MMSSERFLCWSSSSGYRKQDENSRAAALAPLRFLGDWLILTQSQELAVGAAWG